MMNEYVSPSRVVVGVDFSAGCADAVAEGRRMAHQMASKLELVHVARDDNASWRHDPETATWLTIHDVEPESLHIRVGQPWVELARYASETQPAMIVVGSHGGSGFHTLGLGSTTARLGVVSPVPVLVVAPRARVAGSIVAGASRPANAGTDFRNEPTGGTQ
jgi:nucleotide-binding universal stress UspA family protein